MIEIWAKQKRRGRRDQVCIKRHSSNPVMLVARYTLHNIQTNGGKTKLTVCLVEKVSRVREDKLCRS